MNLILYRGHKDPDYLKTRFRALSFTTCKNIAKQYGLGLNDSSNRDVADGFVTKVEFCGTLSTASENAFGNIDTHLSKYPKADAIQFRDGVIAVLKPNKLQNPVTIKATSFT